jgi:phosphoribosyl-ATP pyrophosphohydrolase
MNPYEDILNHYGWEKQKLKAIEENAEFIRALARDDRKNIVEEMADKRIMDEQIKIHYEISGTEIAKVVFEKLIRTTNNIEYEKESK